MPKHKVSHFVSLKEEKLAPSSLSSFGEQDLQRNRNIPAPQRKLDKVNLAEGVILKQVGVEALRWPDLICDRLC